MNQAIVKRRLESTAMINLESNFYLFIKHKKLSKSPNIFPALLENRSFLYLPQVSSVSGG